MTTVIIIQARMTSTRLYGKVMLPLGDKTVLGQVLSRCKKIPEVDCICCAIPEGAHHDIVAREAEKYGAVIYRGSEQNVLARYYFAAIATNATTIMRITSDCPLINPQVCHAVLSTHQAKKNLYTCNNLPPTWPHGFDCEVFEIAALKQAYTHATTLDEKEHVTGWMRTHLPVFNVPNPNGNQYHIRITLDTPEDYEKISRLYDRPEALEKLCLISS